MSDPIRESVARALEPHVFRDNLMGNEDRRRIALEFADTVIAAHLSALEAQGYVVLLIPAGDAGACQKAMIAASNKETGL